MLKEKFINILLFAVILLVTGCSNEYSITEEKPGAEVNAVNVLMAPGLRTLDAGSSLDASVAQLRIMLFDTKTGKLAVNKHLSISTGDTKNVQVKTGKYDFVFIANENAEPVENGLTVLLNSLVVGSSVISDLQDVYFSADAFDTDYYIPMVEVIREVTVSGENTVLLPGSTTPEQMPWHIPLTRLGVRMDVSFALTTDEYSDLLNAASPPVLTFSNLTDRVFLFDGKANRDAGNPVAKSIVFDMLNVNKQDFVDISSGNEPRVTLKFDRIIIPENIFTPKTEKNKAIEMNIAFAGNTNHTFRGAIGLDLVHTDKNYSLPRNNYLNISALFRYQDLVISADIIPWNESNQHIIADEQFYLKADRNTVKITGSSSATITIQTDYDGSTGYDAGSMLASGQSLPGWLNVIPGNQTIQNGIYIRTYTVSSSYSTTANGVFYIQAGNMRYAVKVTIEP